MTHWKVQKVMDARNLLRDVSLDEDNDSDIDKALRAASLSTEIAWNLIEQREQKNAPTPLFPSL